MNTKQCFTDPTHTMAVRELFYSRRVPGAQLLAPRGPEVNNFLGLGVAITPSACHELQKMDPDARKALLTHLYGPDGLGLSVGRICIGSSDYSPELYSYDDVAFDTALTHFSVERDEAYVIPILQEILAIRPDLHLLASPWSPPYWMKTGGAMCGGYMREEFLDCYAEYIVKFIEAYAKHGIPIAAITPQNEVNTQQAGRMPACIWHPETEAKFIVLLKKRFVERNLNTKIWAYDHNFDDTERVLWSLENCKGLADACDGIAFHYYGGAIEETTRITNAYPTLALHFTEGGPRLSDHYADDWCKWGLMIARALKAGYRSFCGWNLMLDETGGPVLGPFGGVCGGLVTRDTQSGELSFSGQYQAFRHISPYLTPGASIRYLGTDNTFGESMSKYPRSRRAAEGFLIEADSGAVAVVINPNDQALQVQVAHGDNLWYADLTANSISTLTLS
ncbi:MAG: hypothetical protein IJX28_03840 [Clostridia bacterium]|nr:hypothetical protein [Clostridia bacterium]